MLFAAHVMRKRNANLGGTVASSFGLCLDLCWGSQESVMMDGTWKKPLFVFLLFRFETERARFYSAEIVCALKFLHRKGIVYRCVAETVFISLLRWAHSQTECRGLSQSWASWYLYTNTLAETWSWTICFWITRATSGWWTSGCASCRYI